MNNDEINIKFENPIFRIIVIEEKYVEENPITGKPEENNVYCAQALEWDLCASGKTIEEALANIEYLLFCQAALMLEHKDTQPIGYAPEDWQKLRNSGTKYICSNKRWREIFERNGENGHTVVHRCDIDMSQTKLKCFKTEDKDNA